MTFDKPVRSLPFVALSLAFGLSACASQQHKASPAQATKAAPAAAASASRVEAPAAPVAAATPEPTGKRHKVWGVVVSFDSASGKLAVKDKAGRVHRLQAWSGAKYTKGGERSAIAAGDIRSGDVVSVWRVGETAVDVHLNVKPGASSETTVAKH